MWCFAGVNLARLYIEIRQYERIFSSFIDASRIKQFSQRILFIIESDCCRASSCVAPPSLPYAHSSFAALHPSSMGNSTSRLLVRNPQDFATRCTGSQEGLAHCRKYDYIVVGGGTILVSPRRLYANHAIYQALRVAFWQHAFLRTPTVGYF